MKKAFLRCIIRITHHCHARRLGGFWKKIPALLVLVFAGWLMPGVNLLGADDPLFVPDEVIVVFKPGIQEHEKDAVEDSRGDAKVKPLKGINGRLIKVSPRRGLGQAIQEYSADAKVLYAQPNYIYQAVETPAPTDYYFVLEWGLKNSGQLVNGSYGTSGADIEATLAWDRTKGDASIVVAVVDTGVDYTHQDLAANMWKNPGGICGGPAGTHGFNAILNTYDPKDDHGHGTHVAGTIGASGNNGLGIAGVNWLTSIMALKFLDSAGSGTTANAVSAIDFAVHAKDAGINVRVINASWGGGPFDAALRDEIELANSKNILFVAASGNSGVSTDSTPFYPANYGIDPLTPNVISVAATDKNDLLASFSNYGASTVHLGAPGAEIVSTYPGNIYAYMSGTSMAAPHVSGAAALILSAAPSLSAAQLKAAILEKVDLLPSLSGKTIKGGRLNVNRAMGGLSVAAPAAPARLVATAGLGQVALSWEASVGASSYAVKRATTSGGPYSTIANVLSTPYVDSSVTGGTKYYYVVTAVNAGGESGISNEESATATAPPSFVVKATPASASVRRGGTLAYTITLTPLEGFSGGVNLRVAGLPSRATSSLSPSTVSFPSTGTSTLTVTTDSKTPAGGKTLTITGTSGTMSRSTTVGLTVIR